MPEILLITPPFTQLNTPYPATAYIKGFLKTKDIDSFQMDLGIEVILELFTTNGLEHVFQFAEENETIHTENAERIYVLRNDYISTIDEVIRFLQGKNQTLARQICSESFLPQASRFDQLEDMEWAFGSMGLQDKAKHLATLYLEDLSDFIKECVDENFGFSRYAERLGRSANSFDELDEVLHAEPTFIDEITLQLLEVAIEDHSPKLICFSVPFPGNLYSAFRCAQYIKKHHPIIKIAMGGGFPNTELREIKDIRVFDYFDFISLDDGELPLELIMSNVLNPSPKNPNFGFLKRTFILDKDKVEYNNFSLRTDYKQADLGTPDYSDLLLDKYISVIEVANPMHSLWSDGRWNKLTMAHGCYWGKCTFCDVSLDYIGKYEPLTAQLLVDRMETMVEQTEERGFHFVDEAAPPALMRELALEILRRDLVVTWWTNIRFEKSFTYDLCKLLKASGCIAVSGGLEVASDRLLELIKKGVTVAQVAQVTRNFTESNIMVHSYLMYGYPTQTVQETIDSLEMVRQLFELGIIQSGFWHQFALTAHSPVGMNTEDYNITPHLENITFANNDIQFTDSTGINHDMFSKGLKKSLFNFMHGMCFDYALQEWFDFEIPHTSIKPDYIQDCLDNDDELLCKPTSKVIWLGNDPLVEEYEEEGTTMFKLIFHDKKEAVQIALEANLGEWFLDLLERISYKSEEKMTFNDVKKEYETYHPDFESFWYSEVVNRLREGDLLVL